MKRLGWLAIPEDRILHVVAVALWAPPDNRCAILPGSLVLHLDGPAPDGKSPDPASGLPALIAQTGIWGKASGWNEQQQLGVQQIIRHTELVTPPIEQTIAGAIKNRPDLLAAMPAGIERMPKATLAALGYAAILGGLIDGVLPLIAILALLKSRNSVVMERVDTSASTKARLRSGKPPLLDHIVVKLSLFRPKRRYPSNDPSEATGNIVTSRAPAFVDAHFKVRRTGIYFWHEHPRVGIGEPRQKTIILTE